MDDEIKTMVITYRFNSNYYLHRNEVSPSVMASFMGSLKSLPSGLLNFRNYESMRWDSDIIFWFSSRRSEDLVRTKQNLNFSFQGYADAQYSMFALYEHSPYARNGTTLDDTLRFPPKKYFIAYPMIKDPTWYLEPSEERKRIMSEHISMAVNDPENSDIRSYTTYSYGIGDQEFIVMYETDSLTDWSHVTQRLREAKQRKWITKEYPIFVGIYQDELKF